MSEQRRHPHVVNLAEIEATSSGKGRFAYSTKALGAETGCAGIGASWYEVPAGKTAFPHHYHCANEESLFVLEGAGKLRIGADEVAIGPGDYATFPIGSDHPHQLINAGDVPLRYLCFSTQLATEVVGYPDSNKVAALGAATAYADERWVTAWFPADAEVGYFDNEDTDE